MRLIVNADDFGMDESATNAIVHSFRNGWISQTTLMVNMPYSDEAVRLARKMGVSNRVGLHLNFTEGKPLTGRILKTPLCDGDGVFNGSATKSKRLLIPYDYNIRQAIAEECRAQVEKFLGYGLSLRHFDSHHHAHTRLPMAYVVLPILSEYQFATVRRPYNLANGWGWYGLSRALRNCLYSILVKRFGFKVANRFGDYRQYFNALASRSNETIELMVHPRIDAHGTVNNAYKRVTSEGDPMQRVGELYDVEGISPADYGALGFKGQEFA